MLFLHRTVLRKVMNGTVLYSYASDCTGRPQCTQPCRRRSLQPVQGHHHTCSFPLPMRLTLQHPLYQQRVPAGPVSKGSRPEQGPRAYAAPKGSR